MVMSKIMQNVVDNGESSQSLLIVYYRKFNIRMPYKQCDYINTNINSNLCIITQRSTKYNIIKS